MMAHWYDDYRNGRVPLQEDEKEMYRRVGINKQYNHEINNWDVAKLVFVLPFIHIYDGMKESLRGMPKGAVFGWVFFLWLWMGEFSHWGRALWLLLLPIAIVITLSGQVAYPFRVWFDSERLVDEHIKGAVGGTFNHDGNSNTDMATGISVGLSED
tara:strand:+ start:4788 stop:5255 length:468 start_codon:yes stop_codon:yes gene_type:complete